MAERAAPPADAADGDAPLRGIDGAWDYVAAVVNGLPDKASVHIHGGDLRRATVSARSLRALLAAAERGAKPGPATRKVMEVLAHRQAEAIRTTTEYGVIVWPSRWGDRELTFADVSAALDELGLEAPR